MSRFRGLAQTVVAGLCGIGVSFVFFTLIPALHRLFGITFSDIKGGRGQREIVIEAIKPSPPPEQRRPQQLRTVSSGDGGQRLRSMAMSIRFSPELAADAGGEGVALQTGELGAEVLEEGQTDEEARPVYTPPVAYPQRARELAVSGIVEAVFVVDHQGRVVSVEIVRSPHQVLADEVRRTISTWRFAPARNKGIPVSVRMRKTIEFKLESAG